ncbi:hypothetical protein ASPBRDRAFT_192760 [Aspergillus brasiliensis CBS 101740]|uniref:Uncharacterized protein n=1 Tax=Aspergillus brasiliensis (strain CBS 101740 / IMI 381727 / IBT 21946) TaxID=767769 RepID=A0A1L9UY74_ASPBC|nr:hypothetical protein ASPBRDRAFT_192760 [Aspergillus brasiliensis CBS 101740]
MSSSAGEPKLIFGIDFGTTETRVMYAVSSPHRELKPRIPSFTIDRRTAFPSVIAYEGGNNGGVAWGPNAQDSGYPVYPWIKLYLYNPNHPILQELKQSKLLILPESITPERAISDFFRPIYQEIHKWININWSEAPHPRIEYYFARPACWTDDNQRKMAQAVRGAGFGTSPLDEVFFIDEAEAVALYFAHLQGYKPPADGRILVCDVGGGTTDIAAFEIRGEGANPLYAPLKGTAGADFGGAAMDAAVVKRIETHLLRTIGGSKSLTKAQLDQISLVKQDYEGNGDLPVIIDEFSGIILSQEDFKKCLQETIDAIIHLINQHLTSSQKMQKLISHVLLVGGPSCMPHLRKQVEEGIPPTTEVVSTKDIMLYSSIVARGAVLRGLRGEVTVSVEAAVSVGLAPSQQAEIKKHGWKQQITRAEKPLPTWILRKGEKIETPYTGTCSLFGYYKPEDTRTAYIYVFFAP